MNLRLTLLRLWFPETLKLWMLDELARVTAEGFAVDAPDWSERSFDDRLAAYARFTAREASVFSASDDAAAVEAVKQRLRLGAAGLGAAARQRLRLRRPDDAFEAWRLLYRQIGIDVTGGPVAGADADIAVRRCFFAGYYTGPVCGVIGALDDGLADGLFGGAALAFSERLTEGGRCCRAVLRLEERWG